MESSLRERVRRLLDQILFCGALSIIALTAIPYGTVDAWWESIFEAAVFVLTMLWIVEALLGNSSRTKEWRLLFPMFALVVFAVVQCLTFSQGSDGPALAGTLVNRSLSADPFETWRFSLKLLAITLSLGLLLRYVSSVTRIQALIYLVLGIAMASALFGLSRAIMPQIVPAHFGARLSPDGSYAQFENRNHFALLMEMTIGLVIGLAFREWRQWKRLTVCLLSGLVLWAALLLTHSRGGVVSLMVEIPVFFFLYSRFRIAPGSLKPTQTPEREKRLSVMKKVALATLLVAAVAASVILIGGDETIHRIQRTPREFTARDIGPPRVDRPEIWRATLKLIRDHPVIGVGFAGYSVSIPRYLNSSGEWTPQQAHNEYLEVLASGGVVGGALCGWFLFTLFKTAGKQLRSACVNGLPLKCGAVAGLFAVAVHSFFDFGLHITVNALVCTVLITVAVKSVGATPVAA